MPKASATETVKDGQLGKEGQERESRKGTEKEGVVKEKGESEAWPQGGKTLKGRESGN